MSFFRAGGLVLALWGREAQIEDANAGALWNGNGGIAVAQNVASEAEVDAVMARAEAAGARILKPEAKTFWGGYNGYFADPDGNLWEVAFNPHWGLEEAADQFRMMISMPDHLFVYGTLRAESAHPMAHRLRVGARHIGKGSTPGLLYDFGSWPGAFFAHEERYRVIGSVFALGPNPRLLVRPRQI